MREILFRAKKADDGKWIEGFYAQLKPINGVMGHFINDGNSRAIKIIHETVGQFTGLYDKNGKRIFEGDIVFYRYGITNFTVIWKNCGFVIENSRYATISATQEAVNCLEVEVIGNIYDNPELIKGENEDERD